MSEGRPVEDRIKSLEYHVHGRGWWLRLVAWVSVCLLFAGIVYGINQSVERDNDIRHDSCLSILANAEAIHKIATTELNLEETNPPSVPQSFSLRRLQILRDVAEETETSEHRLLLSDVCSTLKNPPVIAP